MPRPNAFWRREPTVRFIVREIFATGSFSFEYRRSSATIALVHGIRLLRFFAVFFVFLAFLGAAFFPFLDFLATVFFLAFRGAAFFALLPLTRLFTALTALF